MYIEKITVKNFKSIKEEEIIPYFKGLTVVTGANGSGKSNFIDCMRFVLFDLDKVSTDIIKTGENECSVEIFIKTDKGKHLFERKITKNENNSFDEYYFKNRIQISKEEYGKFIKSLSGIVIDKEFYENKPKIFDEKDFENKVKTAQIYICDNIFCFLDYKEVEKIGKILNANAKSRQLFVAGNEEKIVKKANSIINMPIEHKNYKLKSLVSTINGNVANLEDLTISEIK